MHRPGPAFNGVPEYTLMEEGPQVTQLLVAWSHGDRAALDELTPHVYRELHSLARSYLRRGRPNQTLQPTALINEACLRLLGQSEPIQWENRAHFFGIAARLMRMVLVDYSRSRNAEKRGGLSDPVTLEETLVLSKSRAPDVLEVNEALDHLAKVDERKANVIELRYFGGMDREEIATALRLTVPTVKRDLRLGEAWLRRFLRGENTA
ncbi:MAG TPA: sigma-70 family RNA polymerase sigma factor [Bryobacteraceae bacterium]|nr:sigma-70 family RNA polymerase sigma factor [Bryobacteraceae bacterium]